MFSTRLAQIALTAWMSSSSVAMAQDSASTKVRVETTKEGVTVAGIVGRGSGVASTGAAVIVTTYQDICYAPCEFTVPPGMREIMTYGKFTRTVSKKFVFQPGEEVVLESKPRSMALAYTGMLTAAAGLTMTTIGLLYGFENCSIYGSGSLVEECEANKGPARTMAGAGLGLTVGGGVLYFGFPSKLKKK